MRKISLVLITGILLLALSACGSSNTSAENADSATESSKTEQPNTPAVNELTPHTIGVLVYDRSDDEVQAFGKYLREYISPAFDVEFLYSDSSLSLEDSLKFIEDAAEYGVEGIMSFVSYDLPKEVAACEEKSIFYIMASGTVSDEDFAAVEENRFFVGAVGPGRFIEYKAGSDMAGYFVRQESESDYFVFSGGGCFGNEMHLLRTEGIIDTLQNAYNAHFDISSEEAASSSEPVLLSDSGLNILVCPGYFLTESEINDIRSCYSQYPYSNVLSVLPITKVSDIISTAKLGLIDCYSENNLTLFTNGKLDYLCGKYSSIIGPSFAAIYNAVDGYAEDFREKGKAFYATQGFWASDSEEDFEEKYILANSLEENAYSYEDLQNVIKAFNTDATINDIKALAEASSYAAAMSRRG